MVPCLVRESCVVINKEKEKTQGLRQHLECENGDFAGVSLAGSWQGEVTSSNVLPGITKAKLPIAREKKVLPASWASAQPEAAVYLAPLTSQHTSPCSWGLSMLQAGWDRGLATPVLPSALHKAAPHPPSGLTRSGRNYSLLSPSGRRTHLGCFFHHSHKGFPSCWCQ